MDRATIQVYEERGSSWAAMRRPGRRLDAINFARVVENVVGKGAVRVDLGCGGGRYLAEIGHPAIGIDASLAMLATCRQAVPGSSLVCGDLEAMPFGLRRIKAGWANMSYLHVPRADLPLALADLQRVLDVGAPIDIQVLAGDFEGNDLPDDDVGGRFFAAWQPDAMTDVLVGAGFEDVEVSVTGDLLKAKAVRARTLPDTVRVGMKLLVVGLNPSIYSADAGAPFARPGNRFWPAATAAGVVTRERDAFHALKVDGVGMTDLVKRANARANDLTVDEYADGFSRVERLVRWLRPGAILFAGLAGWRSVVDQKAQPGVQTKRIGGRPVYVMPSPSGANAHAPLDSLIEHMRRASALAEKS
ncbi:MAG TPA: uracil-DNA glycosylase family protein [Acidimicrobiales bacterium]|nr:uracil-DNA glycosylase family protein [Acidimicrobiales bacterium]